MKRLAMPLLAASLAISAGAQQPAKWRLVEEWRVGGEPDGALSFTDVRGMRVMPDGRLVILDYKDQQVHFLDSHGKPLRTVGRKGAGPGEYQEANGLIVAPTGEIIVNDPRNNRLSILAASGDFITSVRPQPWGYGYIWNAHFDPDGRLNEDLRFRKSGDTAYVNGRRKWSRDFVKSDSVETPLCTTASAARPEEFFYAFRTARGGGNIGVPFVQPKVSIASSNDGYTWAGVYPEYLTVERRAEGKCDVASTIRLAGPRLPVPKVARDSAEETVRKFAARYTTDAPDLSKIPRLLPAFTALYIDNANRVWVERESASGARRFEVFSPTGAPVAALDLSVELVSYRPVVITNDHIYAFTSDTDGLQYLVSLKILRN